ncbi:MAG: DUF3443 domain-containing protein [Dissulfurispiraceae bacterium]
MKSNNIVLLLFVLLIFPSCGGGGGGSSSSSSSGGGSSQPTNVLSLTVNGSTCDSALISSSGGYINDPCVSVTICTPGSSTCATINSILLDTGSYGLRIFKQALGSVSLTQVMSGSGSLAECVQYADNTSDWGPVQIASVSFGNEPAVQVPIQVIDSTFSTIPSSCGPPTYTPDTQPSVTGFNGILGVGPFIYDCGTTCENVPTGPSWPYYSCSGSTCTEVAVPLANQVKNPVASLPVDNNGVIVQLPAVAPGGATSLTGSLVFGIGTQSNNSLSGATAYQLDQNGNFITTFDGVSFNDVSNPYSGSFTDTGSNGLFFPSPSKYTPYAGELPDCAGVNSFWFCPPSTTSFSAIIAGASGSPASSVSFQIGNFISLVNSPNYVFNDIGGHVTGTFDWGLPFYFGRNVYIGFEKESNLGTGQYIAY